MTEPWPGAGRTGAQGLSPSARRKGDWDVPFRILSTATLRHIYSHARYNLKFTDIQATVGCAQLDRPEHIWQRRRNFTQLYERLAPLAKHLLLPAAQAGSEPAWFGFPLTLHHGSRAALIAHLMVRRIGSRLFGGNHLRQPYFSGRGYRFSGRLDNTARIMHDIFWVGVYPGLDSSILNYIADSIAGHLEGIAS